MQNTRMCPGTREQQQRGSVQVTDSSQQYSKITEKDISETKCTHPHSFTCCLFPAAITQHSLRNKRQFIYDFYISLKKKSLFLTGINRITYIFSGNLL